MLKWISVLTFLMLTVIPGTDRAQVLTGSDIELTDSSPAIAFEDNNDNVTGRNWGFE